MPEEKLRSWEARPVTLDLDSMTWTCNVCGDTRPDALIGVAKRPGPIPEALWNIRYCLDRLACAEFAQRPGEWAGPADRYRVDVPVTGLDIEDLDRVERIVQDIAYETMWTSVNGVTLAVVLLADASPQDAIRHATAALTGRGIRLDQKHIEARETRR
jgi:hypothetical protein